MTGFSIEPYESEVEDYEPWLAERVVDRPQRYAAKGTSALSGIADHAIALLIARGSKTGKTLAPLAPLVEDALVKLAAQSAREALSWVELRVFDVLGALASSGIELSPASYATAKPILSGIPTSRRDERMYNHWHRGFVALALDVPEVYRGIAGFELREPIPFTAGQTFGPNIQGCLAHFAGAVESGAPLDACLPAWADLSAYAFPLRQANSFLPSCFLWGAWILQHRIARQPLATVADWMHDSLYRLAGAAP